MDLNSKQFHLNLSKLLFKVQIHEHLETWLNSCSPSELKGLKIIGSVVKNKGVKKFRPAQSEKPNIAKDIRNRTMTSFYKKDFCQELSPTGNNEDLFKFIKLKDLKYSSILEYETLLYLEKWIELKDDEKFVKMMLECLKGLFSVAGSKKNTFLTTNQANGSKIVEKKFSASPSVEVSKKNYERKQNSALRARPVPSHYKSISKSTNLYKFQPQFYENRMKSIMKGTEGILRWIHDKNASSYQDTFIGKLSQTQKIKPFLGSTVIKLLP
jgi:hypothetical protein